MAYRFLISDTSIQAGLRRIAAEQIDKALAALEAIDDARPQAVHDVRKRCKKLRGLIRIVRASFADYASENAALRDIAGMFGTFRDAKVMQDTYDEVMADYAGPLDRAVIVPIRAALTRQRTAQLAEVDLTARFDQARARLQETRVRAMQWSLDDRSWDALGSGIAKTYARARKAMDRAAKKAGTNKGGERHHEWRKRVKYHWYHTRLLRELWPDHMNQRAELAHRLANLLGDHHDCHVFEKTLAADLAAFASPAASEAAIALTRRRRALLEEQAHRLGARLQTDDPKALVSRWGEWWDIWVSEGDLREAALAR